MGSSTGSWILLGLVFGVASLANAANIQLINGRSSNNNNNNIIINGRGALIQSNDLSLSYSDLRTASITSRGHTVRIIDGVIELNENGQRYTFRSKDKTVNRKETVTINGQPAQVEYRNGDVIVELADHTVVAKVGDRFFVADRESFDNRDKLLDVQNKTKESMKNFKKSMDQFSANLRSSLAHMFNRF